MSNIEDLEKLNTLKKKGIITPEEFEIQKRRLLQMGKSQLAYVLLAFFLGCFGIHNFYVGRWKRGLTQLLITLLTLFIGTVITQLWAIISIFTIHTDAQGREFEPCKAGKIICGILGIIQYLFSLIFLVMGGISGYMSAMDRYNVSKILDMASTVSVMARASNFGMGDEVILTADPAQNKNTDTLTWRITDGVEGFKANACGNVALIGTISSELQKTLQDKAGIFFKNNVFQFSENCPVNFGESL